MKGEVGAYQYALIITNKYTMPCSTTVVQDAVNIEVVGSNPTGAA